MNSTAVGYGIDRETGQRAQVVGLGRARVACHTHVCLTGHGDSEAAGTQQRRQPACNVERDLFLRHLVCNVCTAVSTAARRIQQDQRLLRRGGKRQQNGKDEQSASHGLADCSGCTQSFRRSVALDAFYGVPLPCGPARFRTETSTPIVFATW